MNEINNYNANTTDAEAIDQLDQLFARARSNEPDLTDDNFTKMVMNSLPNRLPQTSKLTRTKRRYLPDMIGIAFGLVAVYFFVDPIVLANSVLSLWPNVSISPSNVVTAAAALSAAAATAWWSIERSPTF